MNAVARDWEGPIVENQTRTWNLCHAIRLSSTAARRMYRDEMVHKMTNIACAATNERCVQTKSYSKCIGSSGDDCDYRHRAVMRRFDTIGRSMCLVPGLLAAGVRCDPIHPRSNRHSYRRRRSMSGETVRYSGCELKTFDLVVASGIMFLAVVGESYPRLNQSQCWTRG